MDRITPFAFQPGESTLHRLDARMKLFVVCLVSLSILSGHLISLSLYFALIIFFLKNTGLPFFRLLRAMTYFLILLALVFAARTLSQEGEALFSLFGLTITRQGVAQGGLVVFKFFLVMMTGLLVSMTTRPSAVKSAVQWFLRPVPLVPEKRVAVMIGLALSFIPVLLKQVRQVSDAQQARCAGLEKNPVRRITRITLPVFRKIFGSADHLVLAMESRCYSEDRTDPEFEGSGREPLFFFGSLVMALSFICF